MSLPDCAACTFAFVIFRASVSERLACNACKGVSCVFARATGTACGPEGLLFVRREEGA